MTDKDSKILSLSGLCRRAGGVIPGSGAVLGAVKRGGKDFPKAIFLSSSASERTTKQIKDKAKSAGIELYVLDADQYDIGRALGITASLSVYALTGRGPADSVIRLAKESKEQRDSDINE